MEELRLEGQGLPAIPPGPPLGQSSPPRHPLSQVSYPEDFESPVHKQTLLLSGDGSVLPELADKMTEAVSRGALISEVKMEDDVIIIDDDDEDEEPEDDTFEFLLR